MKTTHAVRGFAALLLIAVQMNLALPAASAHAKLLEAYYADAIDRELFLTHQRRLSTEQAGLVRERASWRPRTPRFGGAFAMPSTCFKTSKPPTPMRQ